MIVHRFDQYSPEWWAAGVGLPTASEADKIITPGGKLSAQSDALLNRLLAEAAGFGDPPIDPRVFRAGDRVDGEAGRLRDQ